MKTANLKANDAKRRVDTQVEAVKEVEQFSDGFWHRNLENTLGARYNLGRVHGRGRINGVKL